MVALQFGQLHGPTGPSVSSITDRIIEHQRRESRKKKSMHVAGHLQGTPPEMIIFKAHIYYIFFTTT